MSPSEALDAPLPRMQQDLRFRAARRMDFVHRDSQVGVEGRAWRPLPEKWADARAAFG